MMICKCGKSYKNHNNTPIEFVCKCGESITIPPGGYAPPWPVWARAIAVFRRDGEIGIGDTFHRLAEKFGAEWVIKKLGINCGCQVRHKEWNEAYSYDTMPT